MNLNPGSSVVFTIQTESNLQSKKKPKQVMGNGIMPIFFVTEEKKTLG